MAPQTIEKNIGMLDAFGWESGKETVTKWKGFIHLLQFQEVIGISSKSCARIEI